MAVTLQGFNEAVTYALCAVGKECIVLNFLPAHAWAWDQGYKTHMPGLPTVVTPLKVIPVSQQVEQEKKRWKSENERGVKWATAQYLASDPGHVWAEKCFQPLPYILLQG